jgi:hypothetical protein
MVIGIEAELVLPKSYRESGTRNLKISIAASSGSHGAHIEFFVLL